MGNILVTISDRRKAICNNVDSTLGYNAVVITTNDYYTGGMMMPGRTYQASPTSKYRYSINGQEKSDELNDNLTTALYWEYDARIVRRWNVDPVEKVWESPYLCFSGNPIFNSDPDGDDIDPKRKKGMNFFVTGTKAMRKQDRKEHGGGLKGFISSAYTWDFIKAKVMKGLSFGKLKIVQAKNPAEAVAKIKEYSGSNGYVKNMTIDYHYGLFGEASWDPNEAGENLNNKSNNKYSTKYTQPSNPLDGQDAADAFTDLNNGYAGWGTKIFLGNCWAGGNSDMKPTPIPDFTNAISSRINTAMVFGHQAAASTIGFVFRNNFNGPIYAPYAKRADNVSHRGIYSISVNGITTVIRSNIIIHNSGKITTSNSTIQSP